eukprot:CAMPEP_0176487850 /NCGR_PEP_ID=MMETSP0200_2-20121128/6373_1 /TAXON_ID=947934 /ORGANISM="Chaetoceros sp., Strain GSL56" /LENGTH=235 /DNA_ID=CAMNT_0017884749 /DNA_START=28 /DNA_END=735 /DNA_ORIENTATION=+
MAPKKRKSPSSSTNTSQPKLRNSAEGTSSISSSTTTSGTHLNLLSPQVFQESIAKLNVHIIPSDTNLDKLTHQSNPSENDLGAENNTHTSQEQILCTKEAMEVLRQIHGQFIALLASELVSSHCHNCGKEPSSSCSCDKGRGVGGEGDKIKTIMPKHIHLALERMKFNHVYTRIIMAEGTNKSQTTATTIDSTRTKIKKAVQNSAISEDLLKEQERLFATSAAKMREASASGKLK